MADTLALGIKASLDWLFKESLDLSTVSDAAKVEYLRSLTDGVSAGQADKLWHDQRTLAAGAHEDLDLTALTNSLFGSTLTINFAKVKALLLINLADTAGEDLALGGSGGNEWSAPFAAAGDKVKCPADSCLLLTSKVAGWTVANGSADLLRITNLGTGSISYKLVIAGTSA